MQVEAVTFTTLLPGQIRALDGAIELLAAAYGVPACPELLEDELSRYANEHSLVAMLGSVPIGMISTAWKSPKILEIWGIAIHPQHQGNGLGKQLYTEIVHQFHPQEIHGVTRNPRAALARQKALEPLGYTTYLGDIEYCHSPALHMNEIDTIGMPEWIKNTFTLHQEVLQNQTKSGVPVLQLLSTNYLATGYAAST